MTIVVPCPHCNTKFNLKPELVGKLMRCPNIGCRKEFTVREQSRPVEPPPSLPPEPLPLPDEPGNAPKRPAGLPKGKKVDKPRPVGIPTKPPAGIVEAQIVEAAVIAPPKVKEVVWTEDANLPQPKQKAGKQSPPTKGKKKPAVVLPIRRRKKKKNLGPIIIIGGIVAIVLVVLVAGIYMLKNQAASEAQAAEQADKEFKKPDYAAAAKLYEKLATENAEGENGPKYKFLAEVCNTLKDVQSVTVRENPDPALKKYLEFVDANFKNEFANDPPIRREILKAGKKLSDDMAYYGEERIKAFQSDRTGKASERDRAEKAIASGRELLVKVGTFRTNDDEPLDRERKSFDDVEEKLKLEQRRTAALAKAAAKLVNLSDSMLQEVEGELGAEGFLSDPEVQEMLAAAKGKLQALVKYDADPRAPSKVPQAATASLLFVTPIGKTQNPLSNSPVEVASSVFLALARGILYAIDETSGTMLWSVRIGQEITDLPTVARVGLDGGAADLAVVTSNAGGEAAVAGYLLRTGEAMWYQPLPAPAAGPAVVVGTRAFIPVRDSLGTIYEFDLNTGERKGRIRLGQPAGPGAVLRPGTNLLYVAADARRIFVIDVALRDEDNKPKVPRCVQVIATGHLAGTLRTPPYIVGPEGESPAEQRWLMLSQATGPGAMKIRAFQIMPVQPLAPDAKLPPETAPSGFSELPMRGWAWYPPATDGERLAVVSDVGQVRLFEVKQPTNFDQPVFSIPEPRLPLALDGSPVRGIVFPAEEAAFWVLANGTLQKYRLGLVASSGVETLAVGPPISLGEAIQPPQLNNRKDAVCLVVRSQNSDGCRAVLLGLRDGIFRWQRQLGMVPAITPIPQGNSALLVAKDGSLIEVPVENGASQGHAIPVPEKWVISTPPENAISSTSVVVSSDGKTIYTITQIIVNEELKQVPKFLIRRIVGGKVVHEGSVNAPVLSTGQAASLAGPPAILGESLVMPLTDMFIYRHTPGTSRSNPDTIVAGPNWSGDQRINASTRCYITPLSDAAFLTSDGSKKLARWEWPKDGRYTPAGGWELRDQPTGPGLMLPGMGGAGAARLMIADASGAVWLYPNDRGGTFLKRWQPGTDEIPTGKPTSQLMMQLDANNLPIVAYAIEDKYLVCIDPDKDKPLWVIPMGDDVEATLVGGPQSVGGGRWAATDLGGRVTIYDAKSNKPLASVSVGVRFKFTEETFAALSNETVPEMTQSKLMPLKDREMSREELLKELSKALTPEEHAKWRPLVLRHTAFGLTGAVPSVASSPLGTSSLLIPFSDGSVVVLPMPTGPVAAADPKTEK